MKPFFFYLLPLSCGICLAFQTLSNNLLQQYIGKAATSMVVHFVGTVFSFFVWIFVAKYFETGAVPNLANLTKAPFFSLIGGALGTFCVVLSLMSLRYFSMASVFSFIILGQLITAALIDHFAFFGLTHIALSATRIGGMFLLILGAYFVNKV